MAKINIALPIKVNLPEDWVEQIVNRLKNDPEAEWVQIVRCKDCRWGTKKFGNVECNGEYHGYEWFCPNGKGE